MSNTVQFNVSGSAVPIPAQGRRSWGNKVMGILLICLILSAFSSFAQSYTETFGQNRRQFRKFDWKYFDTKHFRVYHYDKAGRSLGRYVAEEAENDIALVEKRLGGQFPRKFNIVLYNSYEEYRQTNIGLKVESGAPENTRAGTLNLVDDKLVVYFTGQHSDLRHQILTGMSRVVMEKMIFGDNLKKMVKNALLLNLPPWVTEGYIAYLVDGWDAKSSSEWKSLLDARPNAGFYELSGQYPELAGKAFWKFVSDQYSLSTVKNLLYSMQKRTSLNKGMKDPTNLNMKVTKAYDSCMKYYKSVYAADALNEEQPDGSKGLIAIKLPTNNATIRNIVVSPRGSDVAYVSWRDGEFTVYTQKTSGEQERSPLLEGGERDLTEQTDPDYPMIVYSNTGTKLAILYKKGKQTRLRIYNSLKGKVENIVIPKNRFDRVLGMTFMEDDNKMVFSAIKKSQTDLYSFTIKGSKMENITDDVWDDVAPVFISGGSRKGILFLSNRPKPDMNVAQSVNEMPTGQMNVFFYNTTTKRTELLQCTHNTSGKISQPIQYGYDNFAYLLDANGIRNKYVVMFGRTSHNMDSAYSVPVTNYSTSILSHQFNLAANEAADVIQVGDHYQVYFHPIIMPGSGVAPKVLVPTKLSIEKPEPAVSPAKARFDFKNRFNKPQEETEMPEVKGGNSFQTEFTDTAAPVKPRARNRQRAKEEQRARDMNDSSALTVITDSSYLNMKPTPYRLSFTPDFISVRLDNSILFSQYQSFAKDGGQYVNPSLGTLTTLSLNELMENHRFTGGFQLPLDLASSAYYLQYQNFTHMVDWGLTFLHEQSRDSKTVAFVDAAGNIVGTQDYAFKSAMEMIQSDITYPISRVKSVKFHTSLREEKLTPKAVDTISLYRLDNFFPTQYWSMIRLEYVFDNTISPTDNIRFGTRYKAYTEYMYELSEGKQSCYNIGFDFRTYQKLYKNVIWATRVAYAHSDGTSEVEYQMGGVDNWLSPKQAPASNTSGNPGFIDLATNLRGYYQNARSGNNFAVINTEIRLPILTTFVRRPIQSATLKNLQFVAFMDAGSAWTGFLPNTSDATNTTYNYPTLTSPASPTNNIFVQATVPNGNGLALGYGAGLRTTLFGYFIRFDVAKNYENTKTVFYFSLGTDF